MSLPNLFVGFALAAVKHTFVSYHPLEIVLRFFESVTWGIPIAAAVLLVLLIAGVITGSRRYAALLAIALNVAALALVVFRVGLPHDISQLEIFAPVFFALVGFGWLSLSV